MSISNVIILLGNGIMQSDLWWFVPYPLFILAIALLVRDHVRSIGQGEVAAGKPKDEVVETATIQEKWLQKNVEIV